MKTKIWPHFHICISVSLNFEGQVIIYRFFKPANSCTCQTWFEEVLEHSFRTFVVKTSFSSNCNSFILTLDIYTMKYKVTKENKTVKLSDAQFIVLLFKRLGCRHLTMIADLTAYILFHIYYYTIVQDSMKFNCPGKVRLRESVEFSSYKVYLNATRVFLFPYFWPELSHTKLTAILKRNNMIT